MQPNPVFKNNKLFQSCSNRSNGLQGVRRLFWIFVLGFQHRGLMLKGWSTSECKWLVNECSD